MKKCFYNILEVDYEASKSEIKKSYRRLALKYHPDKNPGCKQSEDLIKELNEAYECLSDSNRRFLYDKHIQNERNTYTASSEQKNFTPEQEFYYDIFRDSEHAQKGEDIYHSLDITFEESYFGCEKIFTVPDYTSVPRNVKIQIPRGVTTGNLFALKGKGMYCRNSNQAGDLYVTVNVLPHKFFTRHGNDLYYTATIPYIYTLTGGTIDIPWFDGPRPLHIQPNMHNNITISGYGMPSLYDSTPGNLIVQIRVKGMVELDPEMFETGCNIL